jgi:hypothetical protein
VGRGREMANVCNGLVGTFNSRNNDVAGWWAIGVICLEHAATGLRFDFLELEPEVAKRSVQGRFATRFRDQLAFRHIPLARIRSASISVSFEAIGARDQFRFRTVCEIRDDRGTVWQAGSGGICWPHDPMRALRSGREGRADAVEFLLQQSASTRSDTSWMQSRDA